MLAILGSALFSVAYGRHFATQELASTGFEVNINVGPDSTTVTVAADATVWHGVGFGGLTMSAGTSASIYEGSEQLDTRYLDGTNEGTSLGAFWTVTNYAVAGDGDQVVVYVMERANDITDTCSQCYVFDASATTLDIIMARGTGASLGWHGTPSEGNAVGYSLTAEATTDMPTDTPTDTLVREFATQELDTTGFSVTVKMYTQSTSVDVVAAADRWHSVGFGGTSMADGLNGFVYDGVDGQSGTDTVDDVIISTSMTSLGTFWTLSDYVESNGVVSYTLMRDNDITDVCAQCYVFDTSATSIDIIMARANEADTLSVGYHGASYLVADEDTPDSAATYTLTEDLTSMEPTAEPTVSSTTTSAAPTVSQTPSPVAMGPATVFATQELDTTAFSVSVSVGAESTSIDVMSPLNRWHAVGFGGTSMGDDLNGFTYTGTDTLDDVTISSTGLTSLGNFWTVSDYVEGVNGVTYTMMRSNDITDVCADCYVFDMEATSIDIIMARANTDTFTLGYHGPSYLQADENTPDSAATYTLVAQIDDNSGARQIKAGLVMVAALFTFLWL